MSNSTPVVAAAAAAAPDAKAQPAAPATPAKRQPVLFLSHGPGPAFFISGGNGPFASVNAESQATAWYKNLAAKYLTSFPTPRAILVISAHWEEPSLKVYSMAKNSLYFDYYGFPKSTYSLTWPAPGSPEVAAEVQKALSAAGLKCDLETKRGLDHGTFIPLKLVFPEAKIPTLQLSLDTSLDPALHIKIGHALSSLRDSGVLIIGSGQATHGRGAADAKRFDSWLEDAVTKHTGAERETLLNNWSKAPSAARAHPREEHLIPMHVCIGAAATEAAKKIHNFFPPGFEDLSLACYLFSS